MRFRILVLAAVTAGAILPLRALEEPSVKRGMILHYGRAWVQELEYGAPVKDGGRLVLRADLGSVRVKPGASGRLQCFVRLEVYSGNEAEARSYLSRCELVARRAEGSTYLTGRFPAERHRSRPLSVTFEISVPSRFNLDLETQGGGVTVGKLDGELRAVTAGGDIRAGDVTGPVRVETAGGSIDLGNIGQRVESHTAGGSIHVGDVKGNATLETSGGEIVAGTIEGTVRAQTAGGDIALRAASGPIIAETAGGQILLGQCGANVRAATAGGSIRLEKARGRVQAETAGGSIDLLQVMGGVRAITSAGHILAGINANRNSFVPSDLKTSVGDVQVFLPVDLPLTIDAVIDQAAGHRIVSPDFPLNIQGVQEYCTVGTVRGHGTLQGGGPELRVRTVMGNIEIRKFDAQALMQLKLAQEAFWKRWQERWQERQERFQELEDLGRQSEERQQQRQRQLEERQREREERKRERMKLRFPD